MDAGPPLVFVGIATRDTIVLVDRYPGPDERVVVDDLVEAGGGPAATAAVAAARLGSDVAFVGGVGDDADGDAILAGLTAEGIDVSGVARVAGARSAASVVVVASGSATRAIFNRPPGPLHTSARGWELVTGAAWLHVDQAGWAAVGGWWRDRSSRPKLSIDAGNPIEGFDPGGVDLYVPTVSALRRRYHDGDLEPRALLERAVAEGAVTVVATDGSRGAYAVGADQPFVHVPAADGTVLSTLGAGDVFHGALLAAVARRMPLPDALAYANEVAVLSCRGLDGRSAIPDDATTLAALAGRVP